MMYAVLEKFLKKLQDVDFIYEFLLNRFPWNIPWMCKSWDKQWI